MKSGHRILHEPSRRAAAALAMEGHAYGFRHRISPYKISASQPGEGSTKAWRSICVNCIAPWILTYTSFNVARAVFVILTWRLDLLFSTAVVRGTRSWNVGKCWKPQELLRLPDIAARHLIEAQKSFIFTDRYTLKSASWNLQNWMNNNR